MEASLLPLIGHFDANGKLVELIGHLMRSNPLPAALSAESRGTILCHGPDSYVSPEHAGLLNWAPTWNYAKLKIRAEVTFDPALTEPALDLLIAAMEDGRARPWSTAELGGRYRGMIGHIIGFRARVTGLTGRSEEHTSELQSLMRISYVVICLKKKKISTSKNQPSNTCTKSTRLTHTLCICKN